MQLGEESAANKAIGSFGGFSFWSEGSDSEVWAHRLIKSRKVGGNYVVFMMLCNSICLPWRWWIVCLLVPHAFLELKNLDWIWCLSSKSIVTSLLPFLTTTSCSLRDIRDIFDPRIFLDQLTMRKCRACAVASVDALSKITTLQLFHFCCLSPKSIYNYIW